MLVEVLRETAGFSTTHKTWSFFGLFFFSFLFFFFFWGGRGCKRTGIVWIVDCFVFSRTSSFTKNAALVEVPYRGQMERRLKLQLLVFFNNPWISEDPPPSEEST